MKATNLRISLIRVDGGTQPRARTNLEAVAEYAEAMQDGAKFPPIVVFFDGSEYWLADGFHRRDAAIRAGFEDIEAEIKQGTLRDAVLYSVGVNTAHGLRRTNDDKRRAVLRLLEDEEWSAWSDREIARRCAVSNNFVSSLRPSLSSDDSEPRTYTTKHGTTATMNTERIGRTPRPVDRIEPEAEPREEAPPRKYEPIGQDTPIEKPAPASHFDAKRTAAYQALELYLDSLDAQERADEIRAILIWLEAYGEVAE